MRASVLEEQYRLYAKIQGLPEAKAEYMFFPGRKWRFDFCYPDKKVAVEIEGGTWCGGRHTRGSGFGKDCEKYNNAVLAGWKVLRFTSKELKDGSAYKMVKELLAKP